MSHDFLIELTCAEYDAMKDRIAALEARCAALTEDWYKERDALLGSTKETACDCGNPFGAQSQSHAPGCAGHVEVSGIRIGSAGTKSQPP